MSVRVNGAGDDFQIPLDRRMTPEEKAAFKEWRKKDAERLKKQAEAQAKQGCNKCRRNRG